MKKIVILLSAIFSIFTFQSNGQLLAGGDMEVWKSYTGGMTSMQKPTSWNCSDSLVGLVKLLGSKTYSARITKSTTVKHGGTASAKMASTDLTDSLPTILSNGNFTGDLTALAAGDFTSLKYTGGTNVTKRIQFIHSWIQYAHTGTIDSGRVNVTAFKNGIAVGGKDSTVGEGFTIIKSLTAFTKIETSIKYVNATIVPDRIVVTFTVSVMPNPIVGTVMYVDDVYMSDPTGIEMPLVNDNQVAIFPNPASTILNIQTNNYKNSIVKIFNDLGQLQLTNTILQNTILDISTLAAGHYILVLEDAKNGRKFYSSPILKQ